MIFIQWNSAYERSTASEQALMLVFFSVQVPHRAETMSCACLANPTSLKWSSGSFFRKQAMPSKQQPSLNLLRVCL